MDDGIKMVDSYCRGCVYRAFLSRRGDMFCGYILFTKKRRPCPAGKGCTARVTGGKKSLVQPLTVVGT